MDQKTEQPSPRDIIEGHQDGLDDLVVHSSSPIISRGWIEHLRSLNPDDVEPGDWNKYLRDLDFHLYDLLRGMAHDISQPLAVVAGSAQFLSDAYGHRFQFIKSDFASIYKLMDIFKRDSDLLRRIFLHQPDQEFKISTTEETVQRLFSAAGVSNIETEDDGQVKDNLASMDRKGLTVWVIDRIIEKVSVIKVKLDSVDYQENDIEEDYKFLALRASKKAEEIEQMFPFFRSQLVAREYQARDEDINITEMLEGMSELLSRKLPEESPADEAVGDDVAREIADFRRELTEAQYKIEGWDETLSELARVGTVRTDPGLIRIILQNYLKNANLYSVRKILIKTQVEQVGEKKYLLFTVCNDGDPIPDDKIGKIWDKGYRVERKKEKLGSGYGLYLTKQAAACLEVEIGVASREKTDMEDDIEDGWTEFWVKLPLLTH